MDNSRTNRSLTDTCEALAGLYAYLAEELIALNLRIRECGGSKDSYKGSYKGNLLRKQMDIFRYQKAVDVAQAVLDGLDQANTNITVEDKEDANLPSEIPENQYYVYRIGGSLPKHLYSSYELALEEAQRRARSYPNPNPKSRFWVVRRKGVCNGKWQPRLSQA